MSRHPHLESATFALRKASYAAQLILSEETGRVLAAAALSALPEANWFPLAVEQPSETCQRLMDMGVQVYRPKIFCHPNDDDFESCGMMDYRLPGYVLVNIERKEDIFTAIKATKGVKSFVFGAHGGDARPMSLPLWMVARFRKLEEIDFARATAKKPGPRDDLYEGCTVLVDDKTHRVYGQSGTLMFLGPKVGKVLIGAFQWEVEPAYLKKVVKPKKSKRKNGRSVDIEEPQKRAA